MKRETEDEALDSFIELERKERRIEFEECRRDAFAALHRIEGAINQILGKIIGIEEAWHVAWRISESLEKNLVKAMREEHRLTQNAIVLVREEVRLLLALHQKKRK